MTSGINQFNVFFLQLKNKKYMYKITLILNINKKILFPAQNLSKKQDLQELQENVNEKIQTIEDLRAGYDKLIEQYNKLSEVFEPENIRDGLKKAADESQEKSEAIAQDFLNRKIDVERFLSTYIECRKLGQARRTKEEKLTHQLNELKRSGY